MVYDSYVMSLVHRRQEIDAEIRKMRIVRLRKHAVNHTLPKDVNDALSAINASWTCCGNVHLHVILEKKIDDLLDYVENRLQFEEDM